MEYIRTILYYLSNVTERVDREDLEQAVLRQSEQGEMVMTTIAQEYIQEGYEQGIEQGMEQGIEQGMEQGMERGILYEKRNMARQLLVLHNDETISRLTGLNLKEVLTLRNHEN